MPTIVPNQTFKHGTETYEEGESYDVSPELAFYFEQCGWVGGEAQPPSGEATTLDVHDTLLGQKSEVI